MIGWFIIVVASGLFLIAVAQIAVSWLNKEGPRGEREWPRVDNVDSPGDDAC